MICRIFLMISEEIHAKVVGLHNLDELILDFLIESMFQQFVCGDGRDVQLEIKKDKLVYLISLLEAGRKKSKFHVNMKTWD